MGEEVGRAGDGVDVESGAFGAVALGGVCQAPCNHHDEVGEEGADTSSVAVQGGPALVACRGVEKEGVAEEVAPGGDGGFGAEEGECEPEEGQDALCFPRGLAPAPAVVGLEYEEAEEQGEKGVAHGEPGGGNGVARIHGE